MEGQHWAVVPVVANVVVGAHKRLHKPMTALASCAQLAL